SGISKSFDGVIRRLEPVDALAYREVRLRGLREHPDAFTSSYEEDSAKPVGWTEARLASGSHDAVLGAFVGETLVGVRGLSRESRAKARHKATLFGMYVVPEHRGRGLGEALVERIIEAAHEQADLAQIVLTVTDTNREATALYERMGFKSFGVEPRAI